jgi:CrcB protein
MINDIVLVFIGGGLGALLRYTVNTLSITYLNVNNQQKLAFGTFIANILGSFIIGYIVGLFESTILSNEQLKLFIIVGLLGGFTTFSSFTLEIVNMIQSGNYLSAVIYILSSIVVAIIFTLLGMKLGQSF